MGNECSCTTQREKLEFSPELNDASCIQSENFNSISTMASLPINQGKKSEYLQKIIKIQRWFKSYTEKNISYKSSIIEFLSFNEPEIISEIRNSRKKN